MILIIVREGKWLPAEVKSRQKSKIWVNFRGWAEKWNEWIDLNMAAGLARVAKQEKFSTGMKYNQNNFR
jgi:hypothetical protein